MRAVYSWRKMLHLQDDLYRKLNDFSKTHKIAGRFCAIPVSVLDVGLDTLKSPLLMIERVAMTAINLIGVVFSFNEYSLKDALLSAEDAIASAVHIPVKVVVSPVNVVFQFFSIIIDPVNVRSIAC